MTRTLDPRPLLDAARAGRPWHQLKDCPFCHGRSTVTDGPPDIGLETLGLSTHCYTPAEIAALLEVTPRTVKRWKAGGPVPHHKAEQYAGTLHLTAYEIWPELRDEAIAESTRTCAGPDCTDTFVITRTGRLYCSHRCANRASAARHREKYLAQKRARYAADEAHREAIKERARTYKTTASRAVAATQRAYREANRERINEYRRQWEQNRREAA